MKRELLCSVVFLLLVVLPAGGQDTVGFGLVTPEGHTSPVTSIAFSLDGRLVVTAGADGTARLWEARTGREIRAFRGHRRSLNSASFSPDGKQIVTASDDDTIRLWEVSSGRELHRVSAHRGGALAATFSPDGRTIASAGRDSTSRVWDAGTRNQMRELPSDSGAINDVSFSLDGRYLATAGWDRSARIWDLTFGRELQVLPNHAREVNRVEFSPDGRRLVTASGDEGVIRVWDLVGGQVLRVLRLPGVTLRSTGFCGDGEHVVGSGDDGEVHLWSVATGEEVGTFEATGERMGVARCSADGRHIAFGGAGGTARIWDRESGTTLARLRGYGQRTLQGTIAPGGRLAGVVGADSSVYVWEIATGRPVTRIRGHTGAITSLAFSPDGKLLVTGSLDSTAMVWDVATGQPRDTLRGHHGMVFSVAFGPLGRSILTLGFDGTARVWNVSTGDTVAVLPSAGWSSAQFTQGESAIASLSRDGLRVWNIRTGRTTLHAPMEISRSGVLAFDGRSVLVVHPDSTIRIHDIRNGSTLRTLADPPGSVSSAAFSSDRDHIVIAGADGTVGVWSYRTGRRIRSLAGTPGGGILRILPLLDANRVLISRSDGTVTLWNYATGEELLRRYLLGPSDWVAVTPDGRFEGTEGGMRRLHYAKGIETAPLEAFFDRYYFPGLTQSVMNGAPRGRGPDVRRESGRRPVVTLVSPTPGDTLRSAAMVVVKAIDGGGGVEDIRLYHNGALVGGSATGLGVQRARCPADATCFRVDLMTGSNLLEATAYSRDRVEAERDSVVVQYSSTGTLPTLHILAFGINAYRNPRYNLNYGRADAAALVASLVAGARSIFQDRIVIDTLYDEAVTGAAMRDKLAAVARRARPEDVFVLFYAGHGAVSQMQDSTRFFLVPTDITQFTDTAQLASLGLSDADLYQLIASIPARKKLMLIDACHSGELLSRFTYRGAAEERALAQLARSSGTFVMSATDSDQFASEVRALGHGVFTYGLLQAMSGEGGGDRRERMVGEIVSQAARLIPELSIAYRTRPQYPMVFSNGQDFPLLVR